MYVKENYSLKEYNTFGLDIKARWFALISDINSLKELLLNPIYKSYPKLILGGGSNILFTGDFNGLVIRNEILTLEKISEDKDHVLIRAGAGMNWHSFVLYSIDHNYQGLENLSLIPGCVGAAPIQNIGAYGVEIKNTFHELQAMSMEDGNIQTFQAAECKFGYRDSIFKRDAKNKYVIVNVTFRLNKKGKPNTSYGAIEEELKRMGIQNPTIRDVSNAVIAIRRSKLPDPKVIGNAGSFFKNPEIPNELYKKLHQEYPDMVGYPSHEKTKIAAGWLIEKCGWKGKRSGNCGMHEKQALVLVNYGHATGSELIEHAKKVQASVYEKFGINLEMEVNVL